MLVTLRVNIQLSRRGYIYTKRQRSRELVAHERLLVRLPRDHVKYKSINDRVYRLSAGYAGEVEVDKILFEIGLPKESYIMKDVWLEVIPDFYIQLDTLIITRHCLILLEIKKYSGTVHFDEGAGKTIRISPKGEVAKYDCVVDQVDRAVVGLQQILQKISPMLPIIPIVVMANAATDIALYPATLPVKYKKQLPRYIRQLLKSEMVITERACLNIRNLIQSHAKDRRHNPLCERYEISTEELQKGMKCLACNGKMEKSQGRSWTCEVCRVVNQSVSNQAVADWFMLVAPTITNRQLCEFLDVNSKSATRILGELNLKKAGKARRTYYMQP